VIRHLVEEKKNDAPIGSSLLYLEELLRWPDYRKTWSPQPWNGYSCLAGRVYCEIGIDGSMYACDSLMSEAKAPNVLEEGFAASFALLPLPRVCRSCLSDCCIENNLLFNIRVGAVVNWMKNL